MGERSLLEQAEAMVARAQDDILGASRRLALGVTQEATRFAGPIAGDVTRVVDQAFDVAQRVTEAQRSMVSGVVASVTSTIGIGKKEHSGD